MRSIQVDEDVYEYIASNTKVIGETASDILRRLLLLKPQEVKLKKSAIQDELTTALEAKNLKFKSAVDRFLIILGEAYQIKKESFDTILEIQGRDRKYFALSEAEIKKSGNSTQPKQIPNSPYWAMTNSPTSAKRSLCRQVLEAVGFEPEVAKSVAQQI